MCDVYEDLYDLSRITYVVLCRFRTQNLRRTSRHVIMAYTRTLTYYDVLSFCIHQPNWPNRLYVVKLKDLNCVFDMYILSILFCIFILSVFLIICVFIRATLQRYS